MWFRSGVSALIGSLPSGLCSRFSFPHFAPRADNLAEATEIWLNEHRSNLGRNGRIEGGIGKWQSAFRNEGVSTGHRSRARAKAPTRRSTTGRCPAAIPRPPLRPNASIACTGSAAGSPRVPSCAVRSGPTGLSPAKLPWRLRCHARNARPERKRSTGPCHFVSFAGSPAAGASVVKSGESPSAGGASSCSPSGRSSSCRWRSFCRALSCSWRASGSICSVVSIT
jgi:hypothetical protein